MNLLTALVFCRLKWNDGMLEQRNNGQKRITSVFGSRFFRSLICLSHEPYYFSTRWSTNGPNLPSFHCSIIPIARPWGFRQVVCEQNEQFILIWSCDCRRYFSWKNWPVHIGGTTDKVKIKIFKTAFSLLMECYFLEDSQFLVYKLVRFAYNWNNGILEWWV